MDGRLGTISIYQPQPPSQFLLHFPHIGKTPVLPVHLHDGINDWPFFPPNLFKRHFFYFFPWCETLSQLGERIRIDLPQDIQPRF